MPAIRYYRCIIYALILLLWGCTSRDKTVHGYWQIIPKTGSFYEEMILADNPAKDTLLYFKVDLPTKKCSYKANKDLQIGIDLAVEEIKEAGYPATYYIHYTYLNRIRKISDTLIPVPAQPQVVSVILNDKKNGGKEPPATREMIAYKNYDISATAMAVHIQFFKAFNVIDSVQYWSVKSNKDPFENKKRSDMIVTDLADELKECLSGTKSVIIRTTLSDSEDVSVFEWTYPL